MFDTKLHSLRLNRAKNQFKPDADFLMQAVVQDMIERLGAIQRKFENGVALFGRSSHLADTMRASPQIGSVTRIEEKTHMGQTDQIASPDEIKLPKDTYDLIFAPLTLHWAADLPGALIQLHQALKADGLLMAALPGPETLSELRECLLIAESEISGGAALRIDPFTDVRDAGGLLQRAGFALPVVDRDTITVRYSSPLDLIRDLRGFGATSQREEQSSPLTKAVIARMMEVYVDKFSDPDGRLRASFSIVSMSGWAPHDTQQKPLKPGSAKSRLADALNTKEVKLKP